MEGPPSKEFFKLSLLPGQKSISNIFVLAEYIWLPEPTFWGERLSTAKKNECLISITFPFDLGISVSPVLPNETKYIYLIGRFSV